MEFIAGRVDLIMKNEKNEYGAHDADMAEHTIDVCTIRDVAL